MTASENSQYIQQLAAAYVVGELAPSEVLEFERVAASHPELAIEVERLQQVSDQILYGLNAVEPPPHLRAAILSNLKDTETKNVLAFREPLKSVKRTFSYSLPWGKMIGSVAALLILYLGVDNYHLHQEKQIADNLKILLTQKATRLYPLTGVNVASKASGSFVLNLEQQTGVVAIQNLPQPPVGRIYRLWAVVDGDKIPCGQLNTSSQGKIVKKLMMPSDFYDANVSEMLVTLEVSPDHRYPTGPVVMKSARL
ncbi:hypothetical protein NIES2101_42430 [Calothrix sp. HK-06]|nr:hypothetical protein NIES2101_42430 [Calothrix sp. HK-06]